MAKLIAIRRENTMRARLKLEVFDDDDNLSEWADLMSTFATPPGSSLPYPQDFGWLIAGVLASLQTSNDDFIWDWALAAAYARMSSVCQESDSLMGLASVLELWEDFNSSEFILVLDESGFGGKDDLRPWDSDSPVVALSRDKFDEVLTVVGKK